MTIYGWLFNFFPNKWSTGVSKIKQKNNKTAIKLNLHHSKHKQKGRRGGRKASRREGGKKKRDKKEKIFFFFKTTICLINLMGKLKYHPWMKFFPRNNFQEASVIRPLYKNVKRKLISVWAREARNVWYLKIPTWLNNFADYSWVKKYIFTGWPSSPSYCLPSPHCYLSSQWLQIRVVPPKKGKHIFLKSKPTTKHKNFPVISGENDFGAQFKMNHPHT